MTVNQENDTVAGSSSEFSEDEILTMSELIDAQIEASYQNAVGRGDFEGIPYDAYDWIYEIRPTLPRLDYDGY